MYIDIYNIISDLDIQNGNTKRMDCPNCGGVKTFTVTNNMGSLCGNSSSICFLSSFCIYFNFVFTNSKIF